MLSLKRSERELRFRATPEKGDVSALLLRPQGATHLLVLGHGASTNMRHKTLEAIAESLAERKTATLRYNFPYSENGTARNSTSVCVETIRNAVKAAYEFAPDLQLFAGGHSFGGRMTTNAQAEGPLENVKGLVLFSFPLHMPGKPDTKRAEHLTNIKVPMLFLTGSRDEFTNLDLFFPIVKNLGKRATLHLLDTANHSYKILKRNRRSDEDVFAEMARVAADWMSGF